MSELPKAEQADTEHIATKLDESLNLKDEEKQGEVTEEETGKAVPPAASTPKPTTAVEEPHAPNAAPQEEAKEDDVGDRQQHLNVVFIDHVDAGRSTIGGQILYLSNMVDERTIQKYEREAKEKNRESCLTWVTKSFS